MRLAAGSQEVIRLKFRVIKAGAGLMDLNFVDGLIPLSLVSAEAEALPVRAVRSGQGRDETKWPSRLHR